MKYPSDLVRTRSDAELFWVLIGLVLWIICLGFQESYGSTAVWIMVSATITLYLVSRIKVHGKRVTLPIGLRVVLYGGCGLWLFYKLTMFEIGLRLLRAIAIWVLGSMRALLDWLGSLTRLEWIAIVGIWLVLRRLRLILPTNPLAGADGHLWESAVADNSEQSREADCKCWARHAGLGEQ